MHSSVPPPMPTPPAAPKPGALDHLSRYGRALLVGLAATPPTGVLGALLLWIAFYFSGDASNPDQFALAPGVIFLGLVFGSWHVAPVTLGVLPLLATLLFKQGPGLRSVALLLLGGACAGAVRIHSMDITESALTVGDMLAYLLAGAGAGAAAAAGLVATARWIAGTPSLLDAPANR